MMNKDESEFLEKSLLELINLRIENNELRKENGKLKADRQYRLICPDDCRSAELECKRCIRGEGIVLDYYKPLKS